jgi:hypothetical protein
MTEIFIEPELQELENKDNAEQWYSLCVELGLNKQAALADNSNELKAPPYMFIDPKTERIIKLICPVGVDYKEYNQSTIPTDVLEEILKCKTNGWYEAIQIFYDNKSPDPFVIGILKTGEWTKARHLIARWGNELLPFEELERKALQRLKDGITPHIAEMKAKMDYAINNIDMYAKSLLNGKDVDALRISVDGLNNTWSTPF